MGKNLITKKIFEYDSNNSGGRWWLKDEDWQALEKNGWHVIWGGSRYFCGQNYDLPETMPDPPCTGNYCDGHQRFSSFESLNKSKKNRYLGRAAATKAKKEFFSQHEAITEFEQITGANFNDRGCSCCGPPHSMREVKD